MVQRSTILGLLQYFERGKPMEHIFTVTGMTCGHCERAVQNAIAEVDAQAQTSIDRASGKVVVQGQAPTQEAKEKVTLCCGNVASVKDVDNLMAVSAPAPEAQYHDVVRGDTLSAIAKKFYGDANKYPVIFEANKPMLSHPDKIYPGQKLRIPALGK